MFLKYSHILHLSKTSYLMVSQRKNSEIQGFEIEIADDAGIRPNTWVGWSPSWWLP
jgi:hypothetical protein